MHALHTGWTLASVINPYAVCAYRQVTALGRGLQTRVERYHEEDLPFSTFLPKFNVSQMCCLFSKTDIQMHMT